MFVPECSVQHKIDASDENQSVSLQRFPIMDWIRFYHKEHWIESFDEVLRILEDDLQLVIPCQGQSDLRPEGSLKMFEILRQFLRIVRLREER